MPRARHFFSGDEEKVIVAAIVEAERHTSGEIRVHIEDRCRGGDPLQCALKFFFALKMNATKQHNGVLIYIAAKDHRFAVLGDEGIDKVVADDFWAPPIRSRPQDGGSRDFH